MSQKKIVSQFAVPFAVFGVMIAAAPAYANDDEKFEPEGGVYISAQAGVTLPSDETFSGIQSPEGTSPGVAGAPADVAVGFDNAAIYSGAIGYRIPKRFLGLFQPSIEVEYNFASPSVSGGSFNGGDQIFAGDVDVNTFSINYQSDIRWSNDQKIIPFWGGGIGITDVDANISYFPNNGIATSPTFVASGSDTGLNLHSNIGVRYKLTDNIDLQARARYQRVSGIDLDRRFVADGSGSLNANLGGSYETVSLLGGLRFNF